MAYASGSSIKKVGVQLWIAPKIEEKYAVISDVMLYLEWNPRWLALDGTIYKSTTIWTKGKDWPSNWIGEFPLRDGSGLNTKWPNGLARFHAGDPLPTPKGISCK